MTSNALKSAILLDAMAAIVPDFDTEGDAPANTKKTFTIHYVYHPLGYREVPGSGEIRVLEAGRHLEKYRGESPSFVGALKEMHRTAGMEPSELAWSKNACASVDRDGDELITIFGSRNLDPVQPGLDCGTYAVLGGTGKFKGFSATGAYSCAMAPAPAGELAATFAMEVMHKECRR